MMSSDARIFNGLRSSMEPIALEKHISTHQLVPPKPDSFVSWPQSQTENNHFAANVGSEKSTGFSFLQALANGSHNHKQSNNDDDGSEQEQVYVHPLDRRSSFPLSPKSLEMCTESLGSETGSDIDPSFDEYSYLSLKKQNGVRNEPAKTRKMFKKVEFPPPLSSISGDKSVEMRSHREGGRLVIRASAFSSSSGKCFRAERGNGRLRLCLAKGDEEGEVENKNENESERDCDGGDVDSKGSLWGGEWCSSRCNGDESGSKSLPSLPFCVAIS